MSNRRFGFCILSVLVVTLVIHLAFIPLTPRESDENVYLNITTETLFLGYPHLNLHQSGEPEWFPYHPPFQFWLWSIWSRIFGLSILSLRWFSSLVSVAMVGMTMWFTHLVAQHKGATLMAGAMLSVAGWFSYTTLLVKIDSTSALTGIGGLIALLIATRNKTRRWWILAGALLGLATAWKHVGGYVIISAALYGLFTRKAEIQSRRYVIAFFVAIAVVFAYFLFMMVVVQDVYIDATAIQIRRSLGLQQARGLDFGLGELLNALTQTYWAFGGSVLTLVLAGLLAVWYSWQHVQGKDQWLAPLTVAVIGSVIMLTGVRLRNPHYLVYAEWSARAFLAVLFVRQIIDKRRFWKLARGLLVVIIVLDFVTLGIRALIFSENDAFARLEESLAQLPAEAVFLSEESVCAMVEQRCYSFDTTSIDELEADPPWYVVVQDTLVLDPPQTVEVQELIDSSVELKEMMETYWKGVFRVYRTPYHR